MNSHHHFCFQDGGPKRAVKQISHLNSTVCQCNHLTHFAILLSARPLVDQLSIIFVAGVEPHLGEGGGVPIGCRSVAVLLHYWFLVSFMWMLMEGVVLYVALVRVFIKHHARYIAAFTVASYGKGSSHRLISKARMSMTDSSFYLWQASLCSMLVPSQCLWALLEVITTESIILMTMVMSKCKRPLLFFCYVQL